MDKYAQEVKTFHANSREQLDNFIKLGSESYGLPVKTVSLSVVFNALTSAEQFYATVIYSN